MPGCLRLALVMVECPGIAFALMYGSKLESRVGKEPSDGDHEAVSAEGRPGGVAHYNHHPVRDHSG